MNEYILMTSSPEETMTFAEKLAQYVEPNTVIVLEGDLGAGKTTFTKGLAKGLGINKVVNSPTFTIIKEYHGRLPLFHMDVYRLDDGDEDLGFDEYFEGGGVTVIEWATKIKEQLPKSYLEITITRIDEQAREIKIVPKGQETYDWLKENLNSN